MSCLKVFTFLLNFISAGRLFHVFWPKIGNGFLARAALSKGRSSLKLGLHIVGRIPSMCACEFSVGILYLLVENYIIILLL